MCFFTRKAKDNCTIIRCLSQHKIKSEPEVKKTFLCLTQLSVKFQILINTKMLQNKYFSFLKLSDAVIIMLINDTLPTFISCL